MCLGTGHGGRKVSAHAEEPQDDLLRLQEELLSQARCRPKLRTSYGFFSNVDAVHYGMYMSVSCVCLPRASWSTCARPARQRHAEVAMHSRSM